jgi:hypothetical protein
VKDHAIFLAESEQNLGLYVQAPTSTLDISVEVQQALLIFHLNVMPELKSPR